MGGNLLSQPITDKQSDKGSDSRLIFVASSMQGWRTTMEDAHTAILELDPKKKGYSFFAVYDGHSGAKAAKYSEEKLHLKIAKEDAFKKGNYKTAIEEAFLGIDEDLKGADSGFGDDPSGCTAVTSLITPDGRIFVGNAGDSRAVLSVGGEVFAMSEDHKPIVKTESDRITKAGGFVQLNRVNGNLALSRAIGDFEFKQNKDFGPKDQIVTVLPEVKEYELNSETEFLVLACDGIWDCLKSEEVVGFIRREIARHNTLQATCEALMNKCLAEDRETGGMGYDNMTVIIVGFLHGKTEQQWYDWIGDRVEGNIGLVYSEEEGQFADDSRTTDLHDDESNEDLEISVDDDLQY